MTEAVLHAAFLPFGELKDVNIPLDHATQKNKGFGFVTFQEAEDAAAAMDNMHNAELYGERGEREGLLHKEAAEGVEKRRAARTMPTTTLDRHPFRPQGACSAATLRSR